MVYHQEHVGLARSCRSSPVRAELDLHALSGDGGLCVALPGPRCTSRLRRWRAGRAARVGRVGQVGHAGQEQQSSPIIGRCALVRKVTLPQVAVPDKTIYYIAICKEMVANYVQGGNTSDID